MPDDKVTAILEQLAVIKNMLATSVELTSRHNDWIFGTTEKDGLIVRTDRLEQADAQRKFHFRAIWTAALGGAFAGFAALAGFIFKHFKG